MKLVNLLIYLMLSCLLFSCNKAKQNSIDNTQPKSIVKVDFGNPISLKASDIFQNFKFIQLGDINGKLIGGIEKALKYDNKLYIKTKNSIFVHDINGKYLFDISDKGEDSQKYRTITDFIVHGNYIEIMDNRSRKVMVYDINGKYLTSWKYPLFAISFTILPDGKYAFYSANTPNEDNDNMIHIFSKEENKVVSNQFKINPKIVEYFQYIDYNNFMNYNGVKLTMSGNNTIYNYENGVFKPHKLINLSKYKIPDEVFEKKFQDVSYFDKYLEKNDYVGILSALYFENDRFSISILTQHTKDKFLLIENKNSKKVILCNKIIDDFNFDGKIDYPFNFDTIPIGVGENYLIFTFESEAFLEILKKCKNKMTDEEWKKMLKNNNVINKIQSNLTIASNPIIVIADL